MLEEVSETETGLLVVLVGEVRGVEEEEEGRAPLVGAACIRIDLRMAEDRFHGVRVKVRACDAERRGRVDVEGVDVRQERRRRNAHRNGWRSVLACGNELVEESRRCLSRGADA